MPQIPNDHSRVAVHAAKIHTVTVVTAATLYLASAALQPQTSALEALSELRQLEDLEESTLSFVASLRPQNLKRVLSSAFSSNSSALILSPSAPEEPEDTVHVSTWWRMPSLPPDHAAVLLPLRLRWADTTLYVNPDSERSRTRFFQALGDLPPPPAPRGRTLMEIYEKWSALRSPVAHLARPRTAHLNRFNETVRIEAFVRRRLRPETPAYLAGMCSGNRLCLEKREDSPEWLESIESRIWFDYEDFMPLTFRDFSDRESEPKTLSTNLSTLLPVLWGHSEGLRNLDLRVVEGVLKERSGQEGGMKLSLAGTSIPLGLLRRFGPLLIWLGQVVLLVHLSFLRRRIRDDDAAWSSPCLLLYPGILARLLTISSAFLLPSFVVFSIALEGTMFRMLTLTLAAWTVVELQMLMQKGPRSSKRSAPDEE